MAYQAIIHFNVYEDNWAEGQGEHVNYWTQEINTDTAEAMKAKLAEAMHCKWEDINYDDANEYPNASEYWGGYTGDENNDPATDEQMLLFRDGKLLLYGVDAHALVSKVTKTKAGQL